MRLPLALVPSSACSASTLPSSPCRARSSALRMGPKSKLPRQTMTTMMMENRA